MRMHSFVTGFFTALAAATVACSQTPAPATPDMSTPAPTPVPAGIRLWEGDAPGAVGQRPEDIPTLTVFPAAPEKNAGASMLVLPGGGYSHLADHEGRGYAEWLAANGITAYVLKYRLGPTYHHPAELNDVSRALRMVRSFAKKQEGMDPSRIGVIGSSAGGHLAATLATRFDAGKADDADLVERESSRPDLVVLCYAVITFGEFAHTGSRTMLLGKDPAPELVKELSAELQVTAQTPPCFLWSTNEDKTVPVENTLMFAAALRRAGVPFSLHVYEKGTHGLGLGRPATANAPAKPAPPWADQLLFWLHERKFLP